MTIVNIVYQGVPGNKDYAGAVAGHQRPNIPLLFPPGTVPPPAAPVVGNVGHHVPNVPVIFPSVPPVSELGARPRLLSQNSKRKRIDEDGSFVIGNSATTQNKSKKKSVVGTSNSVTAGRKMKSPPADIFVWGVHCDTTEADIVSDLASSDINIQLKDVQLKSKETANFRSFKVSVPAEDLEKALDPNIWPLRVKVREWVYYSNRNKNRDKDQSNNGSSNGNNSSSVENRASQDCLRIPVPPPNSRGSVSSVSDNESYLST